MTAFALLVSWDAAQSTRGLARKSLEVLSFRGFDDIQSAHSPGADAAIGLRSPQSTDKVGAGVFVDQSRQHLVIGDTIVFGAPVGAPDSDLTFLHQTLAHAGDDGIAKIHGDFAVVVWDWKERVVHAVRDHFGARSLYYREFPGGIALATDVRQLLSIEALPDLEPDVVLDYLLGDFRSSGGSFYKGIKQVRPGHRLIAKQGAIREQRYWFPRTDSDLTLLPADVVGAWRDSIENSVRLRLASDHPIASYLSGGLDSGSIVGIAHRAYQQKALPRTPPMFTLSALFPGGTFDESVLIADAVAHTPHFEHLFWNGATKNDEDFVSPSQPNPGLREGIARGPRGELTLLRSNGIRTVFSGFGGDELGWSHGYFRDLLDRKHLRTFVRQIGMFRSWLWGVGYVRRTLAGGYGRAPRHESDVPTWLGSGLTESFENSCRAASTENFHFDSACQAQTWSVLADPRAEYVTDHLRLVLADAGATLMLPYRDLRLAEFVLRIPWNLRAPNGDLRRVQREAVEPFLSPLVRHSRTKVLSSGAFWNQLRENFSSIHDLITGKEWASGNFIDQAALRPYLRDLSRRDWRVEGFREWTQLWRIAVFEAWNRARLNYHQPGRHMMQNGKNATLTLGDGRERDMDQSRSAYEKPSLRPIGNVTSLLANNQGPSADADTLADGSQPGT